MKSELKNVDLDFNNAIGDIEFAMEEVDRLLVVLQENYLDRCFDYNDKAECVEACNNYDYIRTMVNIIKEKNSITKEQISSLYRK